MVSEVPSKLERPKTQYCTSCKKKLQIYRKVWYIRDQHENIALKSLNDFYVCVNDGCCFCIRLTLGVKIHVYGEVFEWVKYELF